MVEAGGGAVGKVVVVAFGLGVMFFSGGSGFAKTAVEGSVGFDVVSRSGFVFFGLLTCCGVTGSALIWADVDGGGVAAGVGIVVVVVEGLVDTRGVILDVVVVVVVTDDGVVVTVVEAAGVVVVAVVVVV